MDVTTTTAKGLVGVRVQILKTPPGCCGVLRFGHEGVIKAVHDLPEGRLLILEDGVPVWGVDVILMEDL